MIYKTLFFSDTHLGMNASRSDHLLKFLKDNEFKNIFIVGDFIDFWALKTNGGKGWKQSHSNLIQKLLKMHKKGCHIVYTPGNHDEFMDQFDGENFAGINIAKEYSYKTCDNKILIMHGHQLDFVTKYAPVLEHIGTIAYDFLLWLNMKFNWIRSLFGLKYWSLSQFIKKHIKEAINFIGSFEKGMASVCKVKNHDILICGHVHTQSIKKINDIIYINLGDFIETISCAVEDFDGNIYLLKEIDDVMTKVASYNMKTKKLVNLN